MILLLISTLVGTANLNKMGRQAVLERSGSWEPKSTRKAGAPLSTAAWHCFLTHLAPGLDQQKSKRAPNDLLSNKIIKAEILVLSDNPVQGDLSAG